MTPEQWLRVVLRATGNTAEIKLPDSDPEAEKFDRKGYFTGTHDELPSSLDDMKAIFVQTFGEPPGQAEVDYSPGVNKSLFLMNDRLIQHWLKPRSGNLIERLGKLDKHSEVARELYLCVLSRLPEEEERDWVSAYLSDNVHRRKEAQVDLVWALLNSAEFMCNH